MFGMVRWRGGSLVKLGTKTIFYIQRGPVRVRDGPAHGSLRRLFLSVQSQALLEKGPVRVPEGTWKGSCFQRSMWAGHIAGRYRDLTRCGALGDTTLERAEQADHQFQGLTAVPPMCPSSFNCL